MVGPDHADAEIHQGKARWCVWLPSYGLDRIPKTAIRVSVLRLCSHCYKTAQRRVLHLAAPPGRIIGSQWKSGSVSVSLGLTKCLPSARVNLQTHKEGVPTP